MRNFLFEAVIQVCAIALKTSNFLISIPLQVLLFVQFAINKSVGTVGCWLGGIIHPARMKGALALEESNEEELNKQGLEISLLQSSWRVRDHARQSGVWEQNHTEALEAIGTALLVQVGWDESAVQDHMTSILKEATGQGGDIWFDED